MHVCLRISYMAREGCVKLKRVTSRILYRKDVISPLLSKVSFTCMCAHVFLSLFYPIFSEKFKNYLLATPQKVLNIT